MKSSGLKVLIFEDDPLDIQLNITELKKEFQDLVVKSTAREDEFKSIIDNFKPDIILSDYNLPEFNGLDALNYVSENYPLLPVLIVTGSLDEETAASCIKKGAWDYLLKDHIFRLNPAVNMALQHRDEKIKLKETRSRYEVIFNSVNDGIFLYCPDDFRLLDINQAGLDIYKYSKAEILSMTIGELSNGDAGYTNEIAGKYAEKALKGEVQSTQWRAKDKNGKSFWIHVILKTLKIGEDTMLMGIVRDIDSQKETESSLLKSQEKVQNVLIEIANSVNNTRNLKELFVQIQKSLGAVIDTRNCYVALYDEKTDTITLPFHQDEKDSFNEFPAGKTVTGYVIKTGKAQLVDLKRVEELERSGKVDPIGAPSVSWLGVPLKIAEKIIGVFVVQSYTEQIQYTEEDVQLLEFVSDQIALAIERKVDQDKLKNNEIRQRRIIESSPDGLVVIDMNGMIMDFNSTFLELLHLMENEALEANFFDFIADQDVIQVQNILNETLKTSYSKNFEFKMKRSNNSEFFTETSFGLIHGNDEREGSFVIVIKNIDERKIYEHNLKVAKEKAEESDHLKTAFLSNMSHEIRTPMNAIIGFSELLSREYVSAEEKREYIRHINFAADSLLRLIDDIIDISKIEAGQLKMNPAFFPLKNLFDELKTLFSRSLEQHNKTSIELVEENPDLSSGITLHADEFRLKQVLSNLLSNAIKFTLEGKISFGVKSIIDGEIVFSVKDTGVGISKVKQKYIFERFRQGHETKDSFYGGTGLGLAISQNIVQLMGGDLKVTSEVNKGSEFYFNIPYEKIDMKIPEEKVILDHSPVDWSRITFLIAEDDYSNFLLLEESLRDFKVNIIHAKNGREAVELFKENEQIDLVLMDVQMPEMNGYEATRFIKKIRPEVPVVAQTAYAMAGEREASMKAGCDDYLAKPVIMKELIFILNKYLDRKFVND